MNLESEKEFIKSEIDKLDDAQLVEAIKNLLSLGKAKTYENKLRPFTKEEFLKRNSYSQEAIRDNQLITQEEAQEYFKSKHAQS
ncbi:hypothetical protein [Reichenbachiella ulvae]|uniref:Addiction module component n=1 Tax=Reichenbachiella ulvae TaxID=2980104 RepID=A0ABT3CZV9_9BACT|nr:hypothetical protein [Reichenbachiella ulvae]MCV9389232.1 hypothetical protein [Reichenbachiella ulvae]